MSVFDEQGYSLYWAFHGDSVFDIDEGVVTPVLEKFGAQIYHKFYLNNNYYTFLLHSRLLKIIYDYQDVNMPLEISILDCRQSIELGMFSPTWDEQENRDRFEAFLKKITHSHSRQSCLNINQKKHNSKATDIKNNSH